MRFLRYFLPLKQIIFSYKGLPIEKNYWKLLVRIFEVLQVTLGGNLTRSFRDI